MSVVTMRAAAPITAGQAVRTTGSPARVVPTLADLRTRPFFGVALKSVSEGEKVDVQIDGAFGALGTGGAAAVGVSSSGQLVRATDPSCVSAPNWVGYCDTSGNITLSPQRLAHFDPLDFGAVGDNTTDDSAAFRAMFAAMPAGVGGTVKIPRPERGWFYLADDLLPDRPVRIEGPGPNVTCLRFAEHKGLRLRSNFQSGSVGAPGSAIIGVNMQGVRSEIPEWRPGHPYAMDDRVRCRLGSLTILNDPYQEDVGVHFRCTKTGQSGKTQPTWDPFPEHIAKDGEVRWVAEDWSGITISVGQCTVEHCQIREFTDSGIFIYGTVDQPPTVADQCAIRNCFMYRGDGHGIFLVGKDSNAHVTSGNIVQIFERGCMICDRGFASNVHIGNSGQTCRRSYVGIETAEEGARGTAETLWLGNYIEDAALPKIKSPHLWISGQSPSFRDSRFGFPLAPESTCAGYVAPGGGWNQVSSTFATRDRVETFFRSVGGATADNVQRVYDYQKVTEWYIDGDLDDPGGYFSRRWADNFGIVSEETTGERSVWGPNRKRFPQGFYLGHPRSGAAPMWICTLNRPPTSADAVHVGRLIWQKGDLVFNQNAGGMSVAPGWRAARNGGWGGGRWWNGSDPRRWQIDTGVIGQSEALEPSTANGKVYRVKRFEVLTDGTWIRDDRLYATTSDKEPEWPKTDGQTVIEVLDDTHRILWECWSDVGMMWDVLPAPTTQVTT